MAHNDVDPHVFASDFTHYLAGMVEHNVDAIVTVDAAQRIVQFNHAAEAMFQCPASQAIGAPISRFIGEWSRGLRCDGQEFPVEAAISAFESDGETYKAATVRDISERQRANAVLEERARRLELAQRYGGVAIWEWDAITGVLNWEPEMYVLYGATPGTIKTYADWTRRVHPEDLPRIQAEYELAATRGEFFNSEFRIRLESGEERWVSARGRADYDEAGRVVRVAGLTRDITAEKETETELAMRAVKAAERQEALLALSKAMPSAPAEAFKEITRTAAHLLRVERCGVWLLTVDGQTLESACQYLANGDHYDQAPSLSAALFPVYFQQLGERKVVSAADAFTNPATRAFTKSYLKPLGIGAMLDAPIWRGGRLAGVLCHEHVGGARNWTHDEEALASTLADHISRVLEEHDRLRAESALRESESRLRLAMEAAGIGTYVADLREVRVRVSPELATMLGVSASDEITVEESLQVLHPEDLPKARAYLDTLLESVNLHQRLEVRIVRPDGAVRWLSFSGHVEYVEEQGARVPHQLIGACIDITEVKGDHEQVRLLNAGLERRVAERTVELAEANLQLTDRTQQLRRLALELTRAEERERRRIAQVLHDQLQQLLVGARLHADMIPSERGPEEAAARAKRVIRLIDESIKASRSLTEELSPPVLHLTGLVDAFHWLARWMEQHHQLTVEVTASTSVEPDSEGLSALLFRCVRELLFNVVKHSGTTAATLTVERVDFREIRLTIMDHGRGFDPEEHQADGDPGFGLFSIRERLRLLGGRMSIMSAPGAGTRIILEAPVPQLQPEPAIARASTGSIAVRPVQRRSSRSKSRIRVLLVDDHKILREGLSALLKNQPDLEVVGEASDGYAALSLIRALQPDVILMDINMPGLNGIEATRIINADYPNIRVIGLSMHGANSANAMRDAGAVDFIHKGARADEVLAAIRAHAPAPPRRKTGRTAAL